MACQVGLANTGEGVTIAEGQGDEKLVVEGFQGFSERVRVAKVFVEALLPNLHVALEGRLTRRRKMCDARRVEEQIRERIDLGLLVLVQIVVHPVGLH